MVKEVVWSPEAEEDLIKILEFYYFKIEAKEYAIKLNEIFESEIEVIKLHPKIGVPCNLEGVRSKIIGNYQIVYENADSLLYILRIWDSRQNPLKLDSIHRKK